MNHPHQRADHGADRRRFCRTLIGGAAALALPLAGRAATSAPAGFELPTTPDATARAFAAKRASQPWTLGYAGLQADVPPMPLTLRGRLPCRARRRLLPQRPGTA
jgi:all-trans-8'-apo-beta-carotenal 15,15'-oxygenase